MMADEGDEPGVLWRTARIAMAVWELVARGSSTVFGGIVVFMGVATILGSIYDVVVRGASPGVLIFTVGGLVVVAYGVNLLRDALFTDIAFIDRLLDRFR